MKGPFIKEADKITDADGRHVQLYPDVRKVFQDLHDKNIKIAAASKSRQAAWAIQLLEILEIKKYFSYIGRELNHDTYRGQLAALVTYFCCFGIHLRKF